MKAVVAFLALLGMHGCVSRTTRSRIYFPPIRTIDNPYYWDSLPVKDSMQRNSEIFPYAPIYYSSWDESIFPANDRSVETRINRRIRISSSAKPSNVMSVKAGINKFAMNLYEVVMKGKSENRIFSPLSLHMVLAMAALGAEGRTREELWNVLHLPSDTLDTRASLQFIINEFKSIVGSQIYANNGVSLKPAYQDLVKEVFDSTVETLDFANLAQAAQTINDWARWSTHGRIEELVDASSLSSNTALMLVNAVYFASQWKYSFDVGSTIRGKFSVSPGNIKNVDMMTKILEVKYGKLPRWHAKFIELPSKVNSSVNGFEQKAANMYIILPDDNVDLAKVEEDIGSLTLQDLQKAEGTSIPQDYGGELLNPLLPNFPEDTSGARLANRDLSQLINAVKVFFPKFSFSCTLNLKDHLVQLGVRSAFSRYANFNSMSEHNSLFISAALQKASISVDEQGTTVAAVSDMSYYTRSANSPMYDTFIIDKPFLVILAVDEVILFTGKVVDPTA